MIKSQCSNKIQISRLSVIGHYLFLGACFLVLISYSSFALSIGIDPSSIKLQIKPGEEKSGSILVTNNGTSTLKVTAYTEDWIYLPDGSKSFLKPGSSALSCSSWIKLPQDPFELAPKESKKIDYTIRSPKTSSGSHVSVIFFQADVRAKEGIAVSGRIGTIVYLDTEGDINRALEIKKVDMIASSEADPAYLQISGENNGNSYALSAATLNILDSDNEKVYSTQFALNVLPRDRFVRQIKINKTLKKGGYKAELTVNFEGNNLRSETEFSIKKSSAK